ncbi:uncharacterized protein LOC113214306 isoform X2 [Frankliniella occidentalis]|uniref:Uncharacterized protein LOC113214306 isoform X2 n=1 Tax=Frankliniella occidentalis TaxID=133901 RepID=A0A9C6XV43_FRAOC|nr:uncharacterized protein LOC113214306 isoform X2 [Frankliniella occidentalis]
MPQSARSSQRRTPVERLVRACRQARRHGDQGNIPSLAQAGLAHGRCPQVFLPSVMMALTLTLLALQATGAPASAKKEKDSLLDDVLEARKFDLVGKVKDFLGFGSSSKASSPQPKRPASPKPESDGWIRVEPPPL